jgi:hypothetical protein
VEVMMMRLAGHFVTGRLAGERHCIQPALGQQRLDIAIDRGDTERLIVALRGRERLLRRKRTIRLDEGFAYRLLLARVARDRLRNLLMIPTCQLQLHLQN